MANVKTTIVYIIARNNFKATILKKKVLIFAGFCDMVRLLKFVTPKSSNILINSEKLNNEKYIPYSVEPIKF